MNFKEKVQSMTAKEIIMAMVESLKHPVVKIDMMTFGEGEGDICYGCAATNTICKISDKIFTPYHIRNITARAYFINCDKYFLSAFEDAIDCLRSGNVDGYNNIAKICHFASIKINDTLLPYLDNSYTNEDLEPYIQLAEFQDK